jgi:hypothetical protein
MRFAHGAMPPRTVQIFQFGPTGDEISCLDIADTLVAIRTAFLSDVRSGRPGPVTLPTPPNG